ncbi:MAG: hypothetical protein Phog2KO_31510 [Phototrophicaceae bacterium]
MYQEKARRWNDENQDEHRMKMRQYAFDYLLAHPCVDCGETDPIVLEFDHVRGVKLSEVSVLLGSTVSMKRLTDEIAKCDIRCANCHRRKTAQERGWHMLDLVAKYEADS